MLSANIAATCAGTCIANRRIFDWLPSSLVHLQDIMSICLTMLCTFDAVQPRTPDRIQTYLHAVEQGLCSSLQSLQPWGPLHPSAPSLARAQSTGGTRGTGGGAAVGAGAASSSVFAPPISRQSSLSASASPVNSIEDTKSLIRSSIWLLDRIVRKGRNDNVRIAAVQRLQLSMVSATTMPSAASSSSTLQQRKPHHTKGAVGSKLPIPLHDGAASSVPATANSAAVAASKSWPVLLVQHLLHPHSNAAREILFATQPCSESGERIIDVLLPAMVVRCADLSSCAPAPAAAAAAAAASAGSDFEAALAAVAAIESAVANCIQPGTDGFEVLVRYLCSTDPSAKLMGIVMLSTCIRACGGAALQDCELASPPTAAGATAGPSALISGLARGAAAASSSDDDSSLAASATAWQEALSAAATRTSCQPPGFTQDSADVAHAVREKVAAKLARSRQQHGSTAGNVTTGALDWAGAGAGSSSSTSAAGPRRNPTVAALSRTAAWTSVGVPLIQAFMYLLRLTAMRSGYPAVRLSCWTAMRYVADLCLLPTRPRVSSASEQVGEDLSRAAAGPALNDNHGAILVIAQQLLKLPQSFVLGVEGDVSDATGNGAAPPTTVGPREPDSRVRIAALRTWAYTFKLAMAAAATAEPAVTEGADKAAGAGESSGISDLFAQFLTQAISRDDSAVTGFLLRSLIPSMGTRAAPPHVPAVPVHTSRLCATEVNAIREWGAVLSNGSCIGALGAGGDAAGADGGDGVGASMLQRVMDAGLEMDAKMLHNPSDGGSKAVASTAAATSSSSAPAALPPFPTPTIDPCRIIGSHLELMQPAVRDMMLGAINTLLGLGAAADVEGEGSPPTPSSLTAAACLALYKILLSPVEAAHRNMVRLRTKRQPAVAESAAAGHDHGDVGASAAAINASEGISAGARVPRFVLEPLSLHLLACTSFVEGYIERLKGEVTTDGADDGAEESNDGDGAAIADRSPKHGEAFAVLQDMYAHVVRMWDIFVVLDTGEHAESAKSGDGEDGRWGSSADAEVGVDDDGGGDGGGGDGGVMPAAPALGRPSSPPPTTTATAAAAAAVDADIHRSPPPRSVSSQLANDVLASARGGARSGRASIHDTPASVRSMPRSTTSTYKSNRTAATTTNSPALAMARVTADRLGRTRSNDSERRESVQYAGTGTGPRRPSSSSSTGGAAAAASNLRGLASAGNGAAATLTAAGSATAAAATASGRTGDVPGRRSKRPRHTAVP